MDDEFLPWPKSLDINSFSKIINNLEENLEFTIDTSKLHINNKNDKKNQKLDFLDVTVMLDTEGKITTDVYYKETNSHDYLNFTSHHPFHIKKNIPYNLAKRINVFCTNTEIVEYRLEELKSWLLNCGYYGSPCVHHLHCHLIT